MDSLETLWAHNKCSYRKYEKLTAFINTYAKIIDPAYTYPLYIAFQSNIERIQLLHLQFPRPAGRPTVRFSHVFRLQILKC